MKQVLENPEKNQIQLNKSMRMLIIVSAFMITSYITANVMAVKLIEVFGITIFDAGTITFPISFMLGDVMTEIWGFKTAKKVILLTFLCNLFFVISTTIGLFLPAPQYMSGISDAYSTIFTTVPRILFASFVAFLCGELLNSWSMEVIKKITKGKHLWVRTIASSALGYIFDTGLFVFLAFGGVVPQEDIMSMIVFLYIGKVLIEAVFGTPLSYLFISMIKKRIEDE